MTTEELYDMAKMAQTNRGVCSSGQAALADLLTQLEKIDWVDLRYRLDESELMSFIYFVSYKNDQ